MSGTRRSGAWWARRLLPLLCLGAVPALPLRAQVIASGWSTAATLPQAAGSPAVNGLPESPTPQSLEGEVMDPSGAVLVEARVSLTRVGMLPRESLTDASGAFRFGGLEPGAYQVTIARAGFRSRTLDVKIAASQQYVLPTVMLAIAADTQVNVVDSQYAIAEQEIRAEEHQRVLGIIPNFGVSYVWHAAPLTAGQKFRLAWRSEIDPVSFLGAAVGAGYEQAQNYRAGYGQGAQGFAKRFGATYTDGFNGAMLGGFILPTILRQDPRYYYMGKEHGTVRHRALYAISTVVITRGDNGKWQPNYSNVLGNLSSGAISNLYYPASDRGAALTVENALLGTISGAIGSLVQEFLIKHISTGVPKP